MISAVAIIVLVLLQHGKGADMGAAFGGGASGSLFGATGSANFLSRSTAVASTIFFCATLALTFGRVRFARLLLQAVFCLLLRLNRRLRLSPHPLFLRLILVISLISLHKTNSEVECRLSVLMKTETKEKVERSAFVVKLVDTPS